MADSPGLRQGPPTEQRWVPVSPGVALFPGMVLTFAGLWTVTDGGLLPAGWAAFVVGVAFMLVGAVAWGVEWGLALREERQR